MPKHTPSFTRPKDGRETVPGRIIVKLSQAPLRGVMGARPLTFAPQEANRVPAEVASPLDYLEHNAGLKDVRPLFSARREEVGRLPLATGLKARLAVLSSIEHSENEDLAGIVVAEVAEDTVRPETIQAIEASSAVEYAEPMPARWLAAAPVADPYLAKQWNLEAVRWPSIERPTAATVTIGVLDTGIDETHPDLKGRPIRYDYGQESARDVLGHGTHVAGTIGALIGNGEGIAGIADCKLDIWKIFRDGSEYVDDELYFQALRTIAERDLAAINLSIGGTYESQTERLLLRRVIDHGTVVVAAMGNDGNGIPNFPAAHPGVVAVGACDEELARAEFSNWGAHITLIAPGVGIWSTVPVGLSAPPYDAWNGTSMATPHVTAAVALLKARHPNLTAIEVVERLIAQAKKVAGMNGQSLTQEYGHGLLNLGEAVV